jgi:hypothetical protein
VYPANKSKVYNMQNPNAPPVYTCGICHKEINDNDEAILCESWFLLSRTHLFTNEVDCLESKILFEYQKVASTVPT